jgi:D-alanyl-D-alanine carboxypeptidase (penicillin-binding protein 5/6)
VAEQRRAAYHLKAYALALVSLLSLALAACAAPMQGQGGMRAASVAPMAHAAAPAVSLMSQMTQNATPASPPPISARAAELYDATTGKTLLAVNANREMPMASTTKIMTAVVALTYGKLDQSITVGADAVALDNQGTSIAGLKLGEKLTLRELLYCLMLPSGDDAAIAIADGVGGSEAGFVALMNLEAGLLGLSHTHYANPHGLDQPGHYTTASDLVKLTSYAMRSPTFAKVVDTAAITLPANATHHTYLLTNTNELLPGEPFAYRGAVGVKTGFTGGAGYCLVFISTRPQGTLIGVVLGEPLYNGRFTDATALLNWGYAQLAPTAPPPAATATATATAG